LPKKNEKNCNNREKIIKATIELIGEKGVDGTSLADIARKVGISKGTLYYYYSSKNDLIFDITEVHMNQITNDIFSLIEKNAGDVSWQEMVSILFKTLLQSDTRSRLHLYLVREALSGNEALNQRFKKTYKQWFDLVEDGYFKITSDAKDLSAQSRLFVAVIDGFVIQTMLGVDDFDIEKTVRLLSQIIQA
jgi:AcrR family transcriptional regulator